MSFHKEKLENRIKEELSKILLYSIQDPRLNSGMITRVVCSKDRRFAKIYVSFFGGKNKEIRGMEGLQSASRLMQQMLTKKVQVKFIPLLSFHLENGPEESLQSIKRVNEILEHERETWDQREQKNSDEKSNEGDPNS
ncbi:MAG: 30S ribosome-binding factor RbfA [Caldisericia bacterium]|nr:30S ribosome-binding factor RbfA [Caldisericia bacterium]